MFGWNKVSYIRRRFQQILTNAHSVVYHITWMFPQRPLKTCLYPGSESNKFPETCFFSHGEARSFVLWLVQSVVIWYTTTLHGQYWLLRICVVSVAVEPGIIVRNKRSICKHVYDFSLYVSCWGGEVGPVSSDVTTKSWRFENLETMMRTKHQWWLTF